MPAIALVVLLFSATQLGAQPDYDYLKKEDQKYFQNDAQDGKNQWQRIDGNVREINRLHAELAQLKIEVARLKAEVEELKKKK